MRQYNTKLRFHDHQENQKLWLKRKVIKSGENKLTPKRTGPWTVLTKMPNGVNFQIIIDKSHEKKIVHHDKLVPVKGNKHAMDTSKTRSLPYVNIEGDSSDSSTIRTLTDYNDSEYLPSETDSDSSEPELEGRRRYPMRNRTQRNITSAIPWDSIQL